MDLTEVRFSTPHCDFTIIDVPGHKEFLKYMVSGASRADAAVIVLDISEGICEQSKLHGQLLAVLGIKEIIVAVNKMDLLGYDAGAYYSIVQMYGDFLRSIGIVPRRFVPISAKAGCGICSSTDELSWYDGPTFLQALEELSPSLGLFNLPLRFSVQDVYDDTVIGRVESGRLKVGDDLNAGRISSVVRWPDAGRIDAEAGESVGIRFAHRIESKRGDVLFSPNNPVRTSNRFRSRVFWLSDDSLIPDKKYQLCIGTRVVDASFSSQLIMHGIGETPVCLDEPIYLDVYAQLPALGRFVILDGYKIAGGGIIIE